VRQLEVSPCHARRPRSGSMFTADTESGCESAKYATRVHERLFCSGSPGGRYGDACPHVTCAAQLVSPKTNNVVASAV